ncbi:MAG TPA: putative capsular polysaccharide synthesis family protein [Caulobacteraceae bacterium]|nr:putative capsular polysaccharide synthesis family protein [Caulobacteraceae bacterium]
MILVYQMGKVASRSWVQAIASADPSAKVAHVHQLSAAARQRVAAALGLKGPEQTIVNPILSRDQLRKAPAIFAAVEACRRRGETVRVVTGMRDPVARSLSLIMFLADFYGHRRRLIAPRAGATAEHLEELLRDVWTSVFQDDEPGSSFEWFARHSTGAYRSWFSDELGQLFGVDLLSRPFADGFQRMSAAGVEVLAYRVEDMAPQAPAHARLLEAAGDFLGLPLAAIPKLNTASARRSFGVYSDLRERFRLPHSIAARIYDDPVVGHFYTADERAAFWSSWTERDDA